MRRRWSWMAAVFELAAGCQTKPEVVPSSGPRPAAPVEQVKIYQKPPLKYERLGVVTVVATKETPWDKEGKNDAGFEKLKAEAAKKGANGLLLQVDHNEYYGTVLAGYHDNFYQVPYRLKPQKMAVAEAIYVIQEYK